MKTGEPGSIPIPEWIVITPWLLGSGKFGTPCFRIQAEYFAPRVAFPTFMDIWNWPWPPPAGLSDLTAGPEPLGVVDVAVVAVVGGEATLAIPGDPPPPPQPAASSENAATEVDVRMSGREQRISSRLAKQQGLRQCAEKCHPS